MKRDVLRFQFLVAQGARDSHFQLVDLKPPFRNVIVRAPFHSIDRQLFRTIRRHQNADGRFFESDFARVMSFIPSSDGSRKSVSRTSK